MIADRIKSMGKSKIAEIMRMAAESKNLVSLAVGQPDFVPPQHVIEAFKKAATLSKYSPAEGILELRQEIAEKLKKENGIDAEPSEVVVTNGGLDAFFLYILATINPGDEVLVPDPGFLSYAPTVKLAGGVPVAYPLLESNDFRPDLSQIEQLIAPRTKCIILNTPSNPTGGVFELSDIKALADLINEKNILALSDEVYEKFIYEGEHTSIGKFSNNVITLNSFSKVLAMPGFRVGYLHAPNEIAKIITGLHLFSSVCAPTPCQHAALAGLRNYKPFVQNMVSVFKKRRDLLFSLMNKINTFSCTKPKGAFYLFVKYAQKMSSHDFAKKLINAGVLVIPGAEFGKLGENHIRLSYATSEENLRKAVKKMATVV